MTSLSHILKSQGANYIYNIEFVTHPLLIDKDTTSGLEQYHVSSSLVDSVDMLINNQVVARLPNYEHEDPVVSTGTAPAIHRVPCDFFRGLPIVTGLLNYDPVVRINFTSPPQTPYLITYQQSYTPIESEHRDVRTYSGQRMRYMMGTLKNIYGLY